MRGGASFYIAVNSINNIGVKTKSENISKKQVLITHKKSNMRK